jgi:hypothetical protein
VPWCEECSKYWAPSAMNTDGTCPVCGADVDAQRAKTMRADDVDLRALARSGRPDADDDRAPWHFKLLVVGLVGYLVWRVIDVFV